MSLRSLIISTLLIQSIILSGCVNKPSSKANYQESNNVQSVQIPLKGSESLSITPSITIPAMIEDRRIVPFYIDFNKPLKNGDYVEIFNGTELVGRYAARGNLEIIRISSRFRGLQNSINVKVFSKNSLVGSSSKSFNMKGGLTIPSEGDSSTDARLISKEGEFKIKLNNRMGKNQYLKLLEITTNNGTVLIENTYLAPTNPFYGINGNFINAQITGAYLSTSTYPSIIPKQENASIKPNENIQKPASKTSLSTGTGWLTEYGVFVTNYHVVESATNVGVYINGKVVPGRVISSDPQNDIALISLSSKRALNNLKSIAISSKPVDLAEKVYTVGFPMSSTLGTSPKYSSGEISAVKGIRNDPTSYQITVPINPGNSGGPLLTDKGEVVGVTTAALNSGYFLKRGGSVPQNVNFAVKSAYIMPLIQSEGLSKSVQANNLYKLSRQDKVKKIKESVFLIVATD